MTTIGKTHVIHDSQSHNYGGASRESGLLIRTGPTILLPFTSQQLKSGGQY